jgi:alpha-tubulin suppressor-like RCC1 family protein
MKNRISIVAFAIATVVATAATTTAAQIAGDAFSFGSNGAGQLGLNTTEQYPTLVAAPIMTTNLGSRRIVQVGAGGGYSLLLADDGSVFSFGLNSSGATGLGTLSGNTLLATPIDTTNLGGRKIKQVAAGGHSLLLADDGTVFAFGPNGYGQQGTNDNVQHSTATPIDATNLGGRKITQVAASNAHSLLLADDGTVFAFGNNFYGQLGLGTFSTTTGVLAPTPIVTTNLGGRKITQVAAGTTHNLLLADDGAVFSMGFDLFGATGLGTPRTFTRTTVATPILTTNLGGRKITQVAAGSNLSLLLADDGSVLSFGLNDTGQLGLGMEDNHVSVATPINTTNLGSLRITQVAAGYSYSLILAENGSVFAFGANHNHELGIVGPQQLLVPTPIDTTNLGGLAVTQISAGDQHSLLIAELPGDFNRDGTVDGADYVVWCKGLGRTYTADDYAAWRAHFGQTYSFGTAADASASSAVPEPTALTLLFVGLCIVSIRWRRR